MTVSAQLPGYRRFRKFRNAALRTGVYSGVGMSLVLVGWVLVANRVPFLESFARERNLAAALLIGGLATIPVLRFMRLPARLLLSSLIAWSIVSLSYRALCMHFPTLSSRYSSFQIFMLGAVVYLIFATLSWVCAAIWRVREASASHPNHHAS
jgi:small-conductance mechanosensitive channel